MERFEEILALLVEVIETAQSLTPPDSPVDRLQSLEAKARLHWDIQTLVGEQLTPVRLK